MKLICIIGNQKFDTVQGVSLSDQYNETLDSGSVIIRTSEKIDTDIIKPYRDIFIMEDSIAETWNGYEKGQKFDNKFYKHFLISSYQEEDITLKGTDFKYKIQMFSETKGLEITQLPNTSLTQPLELSKKRSIWQCLEELVEMYSPRQKVATTDIENTNYGKWIYQPKYVLDESMKSVFNNVYAPDFTLNAPNLRDAISKLMIVKDRIPVVYNDMITCIDISVTHGSFNKNGLSGKIGSRDSSDYVDNLRTNYSNALSREFTCKRTEYLGFRNDSTPLMTLANMRVETTFPIYKINKCYLCYYKKGIVVGSKTGTVVDNPVVFLCKQDITKLVKLDSERSVLSQRWDEKDQIKTIDDLAKYKYCTVGYSQGSRYITGWGEKTTYPVGFLLLENECTTPIQIMSQFMNKYFPLGILERLEIPQEQLTSLPDADKIEGKYYYEVEVPYTLKDSALFYDSTSTKENKQITNVGVYSKMFFFEIEYEAYYNGAVIHSKENSDDLVTINDNSSSSLTVLENHGTYQKSKIDRYGNPYLAITARYNDISEVQELGSVIDENIVFSREVSIYENCVLATYKATKDYVLKNYFTTVWAKHRTYSLMSLNESVSRAENRKSIIYLSEKNQYNDSDDVHLPLSENVVSKLLSCLTPSVVESNLDIKYTNINLGLFKFMNNTYFADINMFVSGNSLCMNIKMNDNVTMGNYIKDLEPNSTSTIFKPSEIDEENRLGALLDFEYIIDDISTGYSKNMGIYFLNKKIVTDTSNICVDIPTTILEYYENLFAMPKYIKADDVLNDSELVIGREYEINKDNKEVIDMTYQLEFFNYSKNFILSNWNLNLNDIINNQYIKTDEIVVNNEAYPTMAFYTATVYSGNLDLVSYAPLIVIKFEKGYYDSLMKQTTKLKPNVVIPLIDKNVKLSWMNDVEPRENELKYSFKVSQAICSKSQVILIGEATIEIGKDDNKIVVEESHIMYMNIVEDLIITLPSASRQIGIELTTKGQNFYYNFSNLILMRASTVEYGFCNDRLASLTYKEHTYGGFFNDVNDDGKPVHSYSPLTLYIKTDISKYGGIKTHTLSATNTSAMDNPRIDYFPVVGERVESRDQQNKIVTTAGLPLLYYIDNKAYFIENTSVNDGTIDGITMLQRALPSTMILYGNTSGIKQESIYSSYKYNEMGKNSNYKELPFKVTDVFEVNNETKSIKIYFDKFVILFLYNGVLMQNSQTGTLFYDKENAKNINIHVVNKETKEESFKFEKKYIINNYDIYFEIDNQTFDFVSNIKNGIIAFSKDKENRIVYNITNVILDSEHIYCYGISRFKSVEYWYQSINDLLKLGLLMKQNGVYSDEESNHAISNATMQFVCALKLENYTLNDYIKMYANNTNSSGITIYYSVLENRDFRVFKNGIVVGSVLNYLDAPNYSEEQVYKKK